MQHIVTCPIGQWNYAIEYGWGISGCIIEPVRFLSKKNASSRPDLYTLKGQLYGVHVPTKEEVTRLGLLYGYIMPVSRNSKKFVMTRAARRRGYLSTDVGYNRKAMAYDGRRYRGQI